MYFPLRAGITLASSIYYIFLPKPLAAISRAQPSSPAAGGGALPKAPPGASNTMHPLTMFHSTFHDNRRQIWEWFGFEKVRRCRGHALFGDPAVMPLIVRRNVNNWWPSQGRNRNNCYCTIFHSMLLLVQRRHIMIHCRATEL